LKSSVKFLVMHWTWSDKGVRLSLIHPFLHTNNRLTPKICLFYLGPIASPRCLPSPVRTLMRTHAVVYIIKRWTYSCSLGDHPLNTVCCEGY
jgi:hypothetical protein